MKTNSYSTKLLVVILLSSFLIAIAILTNSILSKTDINKNPTNDAEKIYENISYIKTTGSPFLGNENAPVTIVEYIDFECPICKEVYDQILPQIKKDYIDTGKIKFVFKSLPIQAIHKTAFRKAEAAFCAYDQAGNAAFFAYHNELFNRFPMSSMNSLEGDLIQIASQQNLNTLNFTNCLNTNKYQAAIEKDITEAIAMNANGTPTWLIGKSQGDKLTDTVKLNGLHEYFVYKTVIDQLLSDNNK